MAKVGRNDLCPCGSGQKYKRCCLAKDQAAEHAARVATTPAKTSRSIPKMPIGLDFDDEDELTPASNAVLDLVEAGKLDEAEQAARDLLQRFPRCTMATIVSPGSTKPAAIANRRPTITAGRSTSFARTRNTTPN